jgi:PAS domain S-box-containing protein
MVDMGSDANAAEIDLGRVVNALPALVWTTQDDGRSDFVNRHWCEYTGLEPDVALDHGWQKAIHPEDLMAFLESWSAIRRSGVVKEIDGRLRRSDGEYRWFVFRPSVMEDVRGRGRWCWLGLYADESTSTDGRLRRLWDVLPWQAGFLDTAGVLEFTNRQSLEDFGMTQEQLEQWTKSGIIHVDDLERNARTVAANLATGGLWDHQIRMLYPNGTYRWTRSRCVPVRDAQGNVVRYVTFQVDVDDLKRAENLLAAEVEVLERVARGEPLSQVLDALGRQAERLCSGCFCSILLVSPDNDHFEVGAGPSLPDSFNDLLHRRGFDHDGNDPYSLALIEKARIVSGDLANDPRWAGSAWLAMMATYGYASCCSIPILSGSGEACGIIAVYRRKPVNPTTQEQDLLDRFAKIASIAIDRTRADTALRSRERELRQAHVQLSEGQRLSKTGSFTSDLTLDQHRWSDEYYRIFEIDPNVPPRVQSVRDRVHPDDLPLFDAQMQRGVQGSDTDFTFRIVTPTDGLKHLRAVARLIEQVAGRPIVLGTIQDITERKSAEAASKVAEESLSKARLELTHVARVATLSAMTASITHEVSQPISGILTNSNTCARMLAADPPNVVGAAETVRRTIRDANRASEVIKRLRAMFAKKAPTLEQVDLNEAAQEVIALSSAELRRSRSVLQTDFAEPLPAITGDRVQLQQVILNLLLNAADAMTGIEDRPRTLRVQTQVRGGDYIQLLVQDCGVGIDPHAVEKLFEAFHTTKAHGLGIGLAISRSIIETHKGTIWGMPNDGPGATFGFSIPYASS